LEVVGLERRNVALAAAVFARSFFDYPTITSHWPDAKRRARYLNRYLACTLEYGLRYGEVFTTQGGAGIAVWLPPGQTRTTTWRYVRSGFLRVPIMMGVREFLRALRSDGQLHEAHGEIMKNPHWYLWALAVDPDKQGNGVGTALLRKGTDKALAAGVPCYLETHDERNLGFFENAGFELVRALQIPGLDLQLFCMARVPEA
jgi:ribosomal protein S18 acetylase RimI-like enzyme